MMETKDLAKKDATIKLLKCNSKHVIQYILVRVTSNEKKITLTLTLQQKKPRAEQEKIHLKVSSFDKKEVTFTPLNYK